MKTLKPLKPCPFCGGKAKGYNSGTCAYIWCENGCCSREVQKSDWMTMEERGTWNDDTHSYDAKAEQKAFDAVEEMWNTRHEQKEEK